jgi:hypothetical protein
MYCKANSAFPLASDCRLETCNFDVSVSQFCGYIALAVQPLSRHRCNVSHVVIALFQNVALGVFGHVMFSP